MLVGGGVTIGADVGAVVDKGDVLHATKVSINSATANNIRTCLFIGLAPFVVALYRLAIDIYSTLFDFDAIVNFNASYNGVLSRMFSV